jgi:hypothetical protein
LPIYLASFVITAQLASGDTAAEQLPQIHDHAGPLLLLAVVRAVAFMAVAVPLAYLFQAAAARNPRVQKPLIGFVVLAPALFAASTIAQGISFNQIASDYVQQSPQIQARSYRSFERELTKDPRSIEKVRTYTDSNALDVETTDGTFATVHYDPSVESKIESQLSSQNVDVDEDAGGAPGDALAQKLSDDSGTGKVGAQLLVPAVIAMIVAMIYTGLQATRTGLLTRGFGSLGMALGGALILIPAYAVLAILAWFVYLGLLYLGRVPGGRPPAWEAGEAIPWPRPGEEAPAPPSPTADSIEGKGSEVSPPPDEGAGQTGEPPAKRKRKRRR